MSSYTKAFADDLNITTKSAKDNQTVLDRIDTWLSWTSTMSAKPRKCVSIAFRQFRKNVTPNGNFIAHRSTIYSSYDPQLSISGTQFRSLFPHEREQKHGGTIISTFPESHFKFLGRFVCPDLSYRCTSDRLTATFWVWMNAIDKDHVYGPDKLWIYQFGVLSKLIWPFLIYDFRITFAKSWDRRTGVFLKRWGGCIYK